MALESDVAMFAKRENYIDYLANRPRSVKVGEHGLFSDEGKPVVLSEVQREIAAHKGIIWTHVISLRREDAVKQGYDDVELWQHLLRSQTGMLAKEMRIDSSNLRWYAAYHNEGHHPHAHLVVYSANPSEGYLTKGSIDRMRSAFAHRIFSDDFENIYVVQNAARAEVKQTAEDMLRTLIADMKAQTAVRPEIERQMLRLAGRLRSTGGKLVYGYLKADVKAIAFAQRSRTTDYPIPI